MATKTTTAPGTPLPDDLSAMVQAFGTCLSSLLDWMESWDRGREAMAARLQRHGWTCTPPAATAVAKKRTRRKEGRG